MTRFIAARGRHPGRWLGAALALIVVAHLTTLVIHGSTGGVGFWLLLDVGLAYRIHRRHGATALWWFRAMAVVGVLVFAVATVGYSPTADGVPATVARLGLYVLALCCAFAPALDRHVRSGSARTPAVQGALASSAPADAAAGSTTSAPGHPGTTCPAP